MIDENLNNTGMLTDTFSDASGGSYGTTIDDYQSQVDDFDFRGPNVRYLPASSFEGEGEEPAECCEALDECNAALVIAQEELVSAREELEEACSERPPPGNWSVNRGVFYRAPSGSCSQFTYYGQQYNTATLAQSLSFLGGGKNGYKIINTSGTITALYQIRLSDGQVFPPDPVNADGSIPCMPNYGNIQIKKYNPITGLYGSSQAGIPTGSDGIGEYGVFHRTQYSWINTPPDNPYQIGTIIKETAADEFVFTKENDPCA